MHLSKVVCGNMPGFLATFRSLNMREVLPSIDAALNQT